MPTAHTVQRVGDKSREKSFLRTAPPYPRRPAPARKKRPWGTAHRMPDFRIRLWALLVQWPASMKNWRRWLWPLCKTLLAVAILFFVGRQFYHDLDRLTWES